MSNARADKAKHNPAETGAHLPPEHVEPPTKAPPNPHLTTYAIYKPAQADLEGQLTWTSAGLEHAHGAQHAIRQWAARQPDDFAGGPVMAVPSRSVTVAQVKVETKRQLTLGTP